MSILINSSGIKSYRHFFAQQGQTGQPDILKSKYIVLESLCWDGRTDWLSERMREGQAARAMLLRRGASQDWATNL